LLLSAGGRRGRALGLGPHETRESSAPDGSKRMPNHSWPISEADPIYERPSEGFTKSGFYVRKNEQGGTDFGSIVVIFDEDERYVKYPFQMTWLGRTFAGIGHGILFYLARRADRRPWHQPDGAWRLRDVVSSLEDVRHLD